jgi:hypothetical protein
MRCGSRPGFAINPGERDRAATIADGVIALSDQHGFTGWPDVALLLRPWLDAVNDTTRRRSLRSSAGWCRRGQAEPSSDKCLASASWPSSMPTRIESTKRWGSRGHAPLATPSRPL